MIEYETMRLQDGESFIVFIDSEERLKVTADGHVDSGGYSEQVTGQKTFELDTGSHLVQFSVESRRESDKIYSYW